jgi:hypothetical protein
MKSLSEEIKTVGGLFSEHLVPAMRGKDPFRKKDLCREPCRALMKERIADQVDDTLWRGGGELVGKTVDDLYSPAWDPAWEEHSGVWSES